jgi:hypothetical protein
MTATHFSYKSGLIWQIKPVVNFIKKYATSLNHLLNRLNYFLPINIIKNKFSLNHFFTFRNQFSLIHPLI